MRKTTSPKPLRDKPLPTGLLQGRALHEAPEWALWQQFYQLESLSEESFLQCITHRSYIHETPGLTHAQSYERLEFLGDAVLQHLVTHALVERYPELNEGDLSKFRGALVNQASLAELARDLELGAWLRLGRGEEREGGRDKESLLADAFEALLGGLSLSVGFEATKQWFESFVELREEHGRPSFWSLARVNDFDSKSRLQEKTLALYKEVPDYEAHELEDNEFEVRLKVCGVELARARGSSKKNLMKQLAKQVLETEAYLNLPGAHHVD